MTEQEMITSLLSKGYAVNGRRLPAAPAQPRRMTESLAQEPGYSDDYDANPFSGKLHPKNWRALANRRVPWPSDVNPEEALQHLAGILEYQLQGQAEAARGRSLPDQIRAGKVQ